MGQYTLGGREIEIQAPPAWDGEGVMVYIEVINDDVEVMMFDPETPAELADARQFYGETNYVRWRTPAQLAALFEGPGPWLVRTNQVRQYQFLATDNEQILFEDGDEEATILDPDPAGGVRLTREAAERLILRFSEHYEYGPESGLYVEPVPADDPMRHYSPADPVAYALDLLAQDAADAADAE